MENEYITIEQAADLIKVNERQIKKMIKAGMVRYKNISLGKQRAIYRVLKADLLKPDNS